MLLLTSCSERHEYSRFVNPMVGTAAHGHTFPGATMPFGMVKLSPDTRTTTWDGCSGYHYSDKTIIGFSHIHFSGTGTGGGGDIMFMPTVGKIQLQEGSEDNPSTGYRSAFSHKDEVAEPGYYKVKLLDDNIIAELTTTVRAGLHKYEFPKTTEANVILDLTHGIDDKIDSLYLKIIDNKTIAGFRHSYGSLNGNHTTYFFAEFSEPFLNYGVSINDNEPEKLKEAGSKNVKAFFTFDASDGKPVLMKIGISKVDIDGAQKNLKAEIPDLDFEKVRKEAREAWNKELERIEIKTENVEHKRTFYTALYHSFIHPDIAIDVDGRYLSADHKIHQTKEFVNYTTFSLWDTFRALHPLYTIVQQDRTRQIIRSFIDRYENYVNLPVMEFAGTEGYAMIGYHSLPVIADAYVKGIRGYDVNKTLKAMKQLADSRFRDGKKEYLQLGYIPYDKYSQSVSRTLEYSYDDWCVSRVAKGNSDKDFELFSQRGQFYRNLYDGATGFMRPKDGNEKWLSPFDPLEANRNYTEANAWQYSLFVPQDIQGLITLMGGDSKVDKWLDKCFSLESSGIKKPSDITGTFGQYAQGNEPSHHMAYLYNYVGKPWKTQNKVRSIVETLYSDKPDGLCGNDDAGQMSAWYVFSAMGFYPVTPGMDYYVIGSPLFDEVRIRLENGNVFVVRAPNVSKKNRYIKFVRLNGKLYKRSFIKHEDIMKGGELMFEMGEKPNKEWATDLDERPYSDSYRCAPIPRMVFDDITFLKTMTVGLKIENKDAVIRYALDGTEPDENSTVYQKPFKLNKTTVVKAKAWVEGMHPGYTTSRKFTKISFLPPVKVKGVRPGLKYEYKETYALIFSDTKDASVLKTGVLPKFTIGEAGDTEAFSYTFEGYLKVPATGVYTMYLKSNDGALLYIDDELVVDNDMFHRTQERSMRIGLKAGYHKIKVDYFQMGGRKALEVSWEGPGIKKQEISERYLFH